MSHKKILVVDDAEFNRDLIVQLLVDDYEILQAVDGEDGLKKAEAERPDLIRSGGVSTDPGADGSRDASHGWLGSNAAHQSEPRLEIYSDHRRHLSRYGWRRDPGARSGMRRLHSEARRRKHFAAKS